MSADVLDGLNKEQQEAVMATEGYVRVIAGAGDGGIIVSSQAKTA